MQKSSDLSSKELDELHIKILRQLRDGRKKFSQIAAELGVAENTVRHRVQRLMEQGVLHVTGLISPSALRGHYVAIIGFKVAPNQAERVAKELNQLKGVISASCCSGRFNIISHMLFNDSFTVSDFQTEELAKVEGVLDMEEFRFYKSSSHRCIYVL